MYRPLPLNYTTTTPERHTDTDWLMQLEQQHHGLGGQNHTLRTTHLVFSLGLFVVSIHIDGVVGRVHIHRSTSMALLVGSTSIDGSACCPPPAWSTAEAPLELLPRVVGMLGVLLYGVGVVLCGSASCVVTADSKLYRVSTYSSGILYLDQKQIRSHIISHPWYCCTLVRTKSKSIWLC